ncbi:uncharacterized protein LOC114460698 [Gouania willdenowi]|uniref:uncharacterized protein LOC114460698 n=1 Tax=Gouania willdenowi TaxID=441366 RepID=UPI0010568526|nr:uncharacterized protein LOC114460698 [Gouania willdenowi]
MPRKGRRSQAQKQRWRKLDASELPAPAPHPSDATPCPRSPLNKKVGSSLPAGPFWRVGDTRATFQARGGTGHRHRVLKWPTSPLTGRRYKLVIPPELPDKKTVLIVGNSHLRAIVDGFVRMPESQLSFGFLSACGASGSEIRAEVLHAAVPHSPDAVCVMAPGNNLTSTTVDVASGDFKNLLTTCSNRWPKSKVFVVDFPPRLAVEPQHQDLLRQEYRRVTARLGVKYFSATEHFPLSNLALWSKDGVHLSDDKGMPILVQLFWSAASQHLETPPPTPWVSPKPSPPVRKVTPKLVVRESSPAPRSPDTHQWRTIGQGGKTSPPGESPKSRGSPQRRMAHQQEEESFLPLNPVWFSGTALSAMEKVSPSHLSCLADFQLSPKAKKVASPVHKRRSRPRDSTRSPAIKVAGTPSAPRSWRSEEDAPLGPSSSAQTTAAPAAPRQPRTPDGHPPRFPTAVANLVDLTPAILPCLWSDTDTPICSPIAKTAKIVPPSPDGQTWIITDVGCDPPSPDKTNQPSTPSQAKEPWFMTAASTSAGPPTEPVS